jgi:hypothetical protein
MSTPMQFLCNILLGWVMYQAYLHQPKYNTGFAIISAIALGLAGVKCNDPVRVMEIFGRRLLA